MENILVPIDFSKQSKEAFKTAVKLAGKTNAGVIMLHVLYLPTLYDAGFAGEPLAYNVLYLDQMEKDARAELEKMKAEAGAAIRVNIEIVYGDVVTSIKNNIEKYHCELVIMGSSGMSGIPSLLVGSVTEKVVRHIPVPVLAVRESFQMNDVKDILLPSNLDLDQTDFIREVKKLQELFGATLHLLLINTPSHFRRDGEAREAFDEFIRHYSLTNCKAHFRNYRSEEEGILDFAYSEKMNLIAMATHGRKGLAHLFNGSIAEDVVNKIVSPVWTYCLKSAE
jgi:nucleotide-binding universal stress UspA family protein